MTGSIKSNTAAFFCAAERASAVLLASYAFVAISVDSGCSFDYSLEVLGDGGVVVDTRNTATSRGNEICFKVLTYCLSSPDYGVVHLRFGRSFVVLSEEKY